MTADFEGSKVAILHRERVLSLLRDDVPGIPFPGCWDLPGGGREGRETPRACALRETYEETRLRLRTDDIVWHRAYGRQWFFVARVDAVADLRLGDEGQALRWFHPRCFVDLPRGIPHLAKRMKYFLDGHTNE